MYPQHSHPYGNPIQTLPKLTDTMCCFPEAPAMETSVYP